MKKLVLFFAAATMATTLSAQTLTESKTFDNIYIGINGGLATKTTGEAWMKGLNPNAGLRIGRYFTPVFGLALEGSTSFSNKPISSVKTVVRSLNANLLGTVNLSNWFGGYKGEPRAFEVSALYGFGMRHMFGTSDLTAEDAKFVSKTNAMTSKAALDFAFNLGEAKAWQIYIEPAMVWNLNGVGHSCIKYNINESVVQLNVGVVYKFKNSNGTHNFTIAQLRDQSEIDGLNSQINALRGTVNDKDAQLAAKDKKIADLQKALDDCNNTPKYVKPETATNLQPTVIFQQGKSTVEKSQLANIELIAQYMKNHSDANVEIKGYASPEGSAELNQKLSEKRAEAVKDILVKKYKISADRLTTKGMGATDKLFEQVEFNRVATFNDSTKD